MDALREALRELPEAVFADLQEAEDAYLLVVDLPGASADTTELRAEGGRLQVEARREKALPEEFRYVREDRPLFLDAEVPLPPDAVGDEAEATIHRGVLEVRVPRQAARTGEPIPIEPE